MRYRATAAVAAILAMVVLGLPGTAGAQGTATREIELHKNVRLVILKPLTNLPEKSEDEFQRFLPLLQEALTGLTSDENSECALTFRVAAGIKEVGSAKVKRVFARLSAYRRNSDQEYMARIYLHSYATGGPATKKEITEFVKEQVLGPAKCEPKLTQGPAAPQS
jgi:hypothetical protein